MTYISRAPLKIFRSSASAALLSLGLLITAISGIGMSGSALAQGGPAAEATCFKPEVVVTCGADGVVDVSLKPTATGTAAPDSVQITPLTPGISVTPINFTPIGSGGATNISLKGAKPGSKIKLLVEGTQIGGGSFSGADLCCSQIIDLDVPLDVCPKPPKFAVSKICDKCEAGKDCLCKITVASLDKTTPYPGNLTITEALSQTGGGPITIVNNSSAQPWTCTPPTPNSGPLACSISGAALAGNQNTSVIDVTIKVPADAKGAQNCAILPVEAAANPKDTKVCTDIVLVPEMPKLVVTKTRTGGDCAPGQLCEFTIKITNPSAIVAATGFVPISEDMGNPATLISMVPPVCSPMPATLPFTCNAAVSLAPGQSMTVVIKASILMSANVPQASTEFENCFGVSTVVSSDPGPGGGFTKVNQGCVKYYSCGYSCHMSKELVGALKIEKVAKTSECQIGQPCVFTVTMANTSAAPVVTPISFVDQLPAGAVNYVGITPAPWSCGPLNGNASNFPHKLECKHPPGTTILPGQSLTMDITYTIKPGYTQSTLQNCTVLNGQGWETQMPAASSRIASAIQKPWNPQALQDYLAMRGLSANSPQAARFSASPNASAGAAPSGGIIWAPDDKSCATVNIPQPSARQVPAISSSQAGIAAAVAAGAVLVPIILNQTKPDPVVIACPPGTQRNARGECIRSRVQCGPDQVLNATGICVTQQRQDCGPGTVREPATGRCVPVVVQDCQTGTVREPGTNRCVPINISCPQGSIRDTATNRCIPVSVKCDAPLVLRNGQCVEQRPVCRPPEVLRNGECVNPRPTCEAPQVLRNGRCVDPAPRCQPPEILRNGECVNPRPTCEAPQVLRNGRCIDPAPRCQPPQVLRRGECVDPTPRCRAPQVLRNGQCVTPRPTCEAPQVFNRALGRCVEPPPRCGPGQILRGRTCVDIGPRCRPPQILVGRQCVTPRPRCQPPTVFSPAIGRCVQPLGRPPVPRVVPRSREPIPGRVVAPGRPALGLPGLR
jgi:uncharacterized repeat protein (TIGR01451 family)